MRKWIAVIALAVLICTLHTGVRGAENGLAMENVTVQEGETVYVTWKLAEPVAADAVAIVFSYNTEVLKPLQSSSTWAKEGILQDFDMYKGAGVWTAEQPVEFSGEVCTVAFQVITGAEHFDTKVTCRLVLKQDGQEIGDFTDTVWVSSACRHSFGAWHDEGSLGHGRVCALCERKQSASHKWDSGVTVNDPEDAGKKITTFTCEDCKAQKITTHFANVEPTAPGREESEGPSSTRPTLPPESLPGDEDQNGSQATKPADGDNGDKDGHEENDGHDHEHGEEKLPTQEDDHDHDHGTGNISGNTWIFLGVVVVLIAAAVLAVKKKR